MGSKRQPERDRANHAAIMARVQETLGSQAFAQVIAEGQALDYEAALAEAQTWLKDPARWPASQ